ncbi:hypothetical protein [Shinella zoogloeoides]|uniref:hypothetical protein n=1 Tax=Shinella zoogloeoides TaxID=352475 RepID=UPI00273D47BA|nr:hypothetical protein [Shinella zoogloeoides]WLR92164.1 hypothetical protein Q9316_17105 [Shinella zoogloeoides]
MTLSVEYAAATLLDDFTSPFADRRYSRFAMIFPPLAAREVLELSRDIALHGLRSPIVLLDDEILDGRARFEACRMVGIDPIFETHDGDDPLAFVVSGNLHRRHLNESQRAIVAARLANWPMGLNQTTARPANLPVWRVAEMFRISPRSVATAKRLLSSRKPALIEDVSSGVLSLHRASRMARGHEDVDTGSRLPKSRIAGAPFASICLRNIPDLIRDAEREIAVLRALAAHAQAEDADASSVT